MNDVVPLAFETDLSQVFCMKSDVVVEESTDEVIGVIVILLFSVLNVEALLGGDLREVLWEKLVLQELIGRSLIGRRKLVKSH